MFAFTRNSTAVDAILHVHQLRGPCDRFVFDLLHRLKQKHSAWTIPVLRRAYGRPVFGLMPILRLPLAFYCALNLNF